MRIGKVIIDTDNMTYEEVDVILQELREIRKRKGEAKECKTRMRNMVEASLDQGFRYINRYTGELFNADEWFVYDERQNCTHGEEVDR